jgi:MFS family permease
MKVGLRRLPRTRIPKSATILIAGDSLASVGLGLVLPLTLIYLHQVRAISLPVSGELLAAGAAVGLIIVPLAGTLMDRVGARNVMTVALLGQAAGEVALAWAHDTRTALVALVIFGGATAPAYPAFMTLLAGLCQDLILQQRAVLINVTLVNAAIGVGGAIGATVVSVHHPGTFQALFLANGICCVLFAVLVSRLPNAGVTQETRQEPREKTGYREVLANPSLRVVVIATLVLAFTGYAAVDAGLAAFATVEGHATVRIVALSLTVNTACIVLSGLFALGLIRKLRRSRALAMIGLIWAGSWATLGASGLALPHWARVMCIFGFAALFGVGETFMAPTIAPLVNSLADNRIRGRANALSNGSSSLAFVLSPAISTSLIAAHLSGVWIGLLIGGCLLVAAVAIRLGRLLTGTQDRVTSQSDASTEPEPVRA